MARIHKARETVLKELDGTHYVPETLIAAAAELIGAAVELLDARLSESAAGRREPATVAAMANETTCTSGNGGKHDWKRWCSWCGETHDDIGQRRRAEAEPGGGDGAWIGDGEVGGNTDEGLEHMTTLPTRVLTELTAKKREAEAELAAAKARIGELEIAAARHRVKD